MLKDRVIALVKYKTLADNDAILNAVDEAEFVIRNYTGRWIKLDNGAYEELPEQLLYSWVRIAAGIYDLGVQLAAGVDQVAKSISVGDTRVELDTGGKHNAATVDDLIQAEAANLNKYRRLYPDIRD